MVALSEEVVTFWFEQNNLNYSVPKVRRDFRDIMGSIGISIVNISNLAELSPKIRSSSNKRIHSVLQYPLKPWFNVNSVGDRHPYDFIDKVRSDSSSLTLIVHDIKSIQATMFDKKLDPSLVHEIERFERFAISQADNIITHSDLMSSYIVEKHAFSGKLAVLDVFDYQSNPVKTLMPAPGTLVFAGYLGNSKDSLIKKLIDEFSKKRELKLDLFGADFDRNLTFQNISYKGSVEPDSLPTMLAGKYQAGLIWDDLNPNQQQYYAMIAPHKASLYFRAGLPIVAPSNTHIGNLAKELKIGFAVDRLDQLESLNWQDVDWNSLQQIQTRIGSGFYIKKAIRSLLA